MSADAVIESSRGVSVVEDHDSDGLVIYRILNGKERLGPFTSKIEAQHIAAIIRPRRVTCDRCHETDVDSFPAELGVGRLRVLGDGGWLRERYFGGQPEFVDMTFCPDCTRKYYGGNTDE